MEDKFPHLIGVERVFGIQSGIIERNSNNIFHSKGTQTSAEWTDSEPLTIDIIKNEIKKIPKCQFFEKMKSEGCSPDDGWVLILPMKDVNHDEIDMLPAYVRMSRLIDEPIMLNKSKTYGGNY